MTTTWHAPSDTLARFAQSPELVDATTASSLEQHLVACAECRAVMAAAADPLAIAASWDDVVDAIDRPRRTAVERLLTWLGMPDDLARIVGATPGLRLAWFATTAVLAACVVAVGRSTGSDAPFLVLAPLLPLGAVLLAFLPTEEPAGEAAAATPLFGAGVVIRRSVAALVPTFAILGLAGVALPDVADAARWLLPAVALAVGSLLLATCIRPIPAIATLAATWIAVIATVGALDGRSVALDQTAVFELLGQLVALTLSVLAAALLFVRRDRFSTVEVTW